MTTTDPEPQITQQLIDLALRSHDRSASTTESDALTGKWEKMCGILQPEQINARDREGLSAAHYLASGTLDSHWLKIAHKHGMQFDTTAPLTLAGRTHLLLPLHLAAMRQDDHALIAAIIGVLLELGADVHARTEPLGETPLHLSADHDNVHAMRVLLQHGADVNASLPPTAQHRTPLHLAAAKCGDAAIELLLKHGAIARPARPAAFTLAVSNERLGPTTIQRLRNPPPLHWALRRRPKEI